MDRERYFKTPEGGAIKHRLIESAEAETRDKMNKDGVAERLNATVLKLVSCGVIVDDNVTFRTYRSSRYVL